MIRKSKSQIECFLNDNISKFTHPSSMYGCELNSTVKMWDDMNLRVLMMSSWTYRDVAGNQSIPLVARLINDSADDIYADRSFFPFAKKDWNIHRKFNMPPFGLNSRRCATDFDVIATSVAFLPFLVNVVQQLKMCGIPVLEEQRRSMDENYPLILLGGYVFGNPECISPAADIIWLGEAEDEEKENNPGIGAVMQFIRNWKLHNKDAWCTADGRNELLLHLSKLYPFLYIPRFHTPNYDENHLITSFTHLNNLMPPTRRWVHDLDEAVASTETPVSYINTAMGMGEVEATRGCVGSCAFCAQMFRAKPYRERSVGVLGFAIKEAVKNTGALHAYPCAMDLSMYSQKNMLVKHLLENVSSVVDTQSARVDNVADDPCFIKLARVGGMKQLVLGIEGVSQRMRDAVNKNASVNDILKACHNAMISGFKRIKFFFICNLPGEDAGDFECFYDLMKKIKDMRDAMGVGVQLFASFTPLRLEANTPYQWMAIPEAKMMGDIPHRIRKELGVKVLFGPKVQKDMMFYMNLMGMADRKVGKAFVETVDELDMCYWGGISKEFQPMVMNKLRNAGFNEEVFFGEKPADYTFAWEIIDIGVRKDYLRWYFEKIKDFLADAKDAKLYEAESIEQDRRFQLIGKCNDCGKCKNCQSDDIKRLAVIRKQEDQTFDSVSIINDDSFVQKAIFKVKLDDRWKFLEAHFKATAVRRAFFKADMAIAKRSIFFESASVKYDNWVSGVDYFEVGFAASVGSNLQPTIDRIGRYLPMMKFVDGGLVFSKFSLADDVKDRVSLFSMPVLSIGDAKKALDMWNKNKEIPFRIKVQGASRSAVAIQVANLRDYVYDVFLTATRSDLRLNFFCIGGVSPYEIYSALMNASLEESLYSSAHRIDIYRKDGFSSNGGLFGSCIECGKNLETNILGHIHDKGYCYKCDARRGKFLVEF